MANAAICAALVEGISNSNDEDRVQTALENAADELTNNTNHDVFAYGPKDHNWECPTLNKPGDVDKYLQDNFGQALADAHDNNEIFVAEQDVWILIDKADKYGYGDGGRKANESHFSPNKNVWVGRTISFEEVWAVYDPHEVIRKVVKHNIGHCLNTFHDDGNYKREQINGDLDRIYDVSPMAWSYIQVYNPDSSKYETDSCQSGNGSMYSNEFDACNDQSDKPRKTSDGEFKETCSNSNLDRHDFTYADCELEDMEQTIAARNS